LLYFSVTLQRIRCPPHILYSTTHSPRRLQRPTSNVQYTAGSPSLGSGYRLKRAEIAERLIQPLSAQPPNGNPQDQHAQKKLIDESTTTEEKTAQAVMAREDAESHRCVAQDSWEKIERYPPSLNTAQKTPVLLSFVSQTVLWRPSSYHPFQVLLHFGAAPGSQSAYPPSSSSQAMAAPPRQHSRHQHSSYIQAVHSPPYLLILFRTPGLSPNTGIRRSRTRCIMDELYNVIYLLPSDRVPTLWRSGRENLDHLTPVGMSLFSRNLCR
jgi:hypothetical protein